MTTIFEKPLSRSSCLPKMVITLTLVVVSMLSNDAYGQGPRVPDHKGQVMLIKNTIVAVNHGNITGNYTVLRDLASEHFRKQNTGSDLAATFAGLRKQKLDLSPILVTEPQLTQPPKTDNLRGYLHLVGHFPTRPQAVRFALFFQNIQDSWVIAEISIAIVPSESIVSSRRLPQSSTHSRTLGPRSTQRPPSYASRPTRSR